MKFSAINLLNTTATNSTIHFLQAQTCFFHRLLVPTGGKISTRNFWTPSSLTNAHFRFAYTVSCVNVIFASFPVFFCGIDSCLRGSRFDSLDSMFVFHFVVFFLELFC